MPTYYDPITRGYLEIDNTTILYVAKIDGKYQIQGISEGIEHFSYNPHLCAQTADLVFNGNFNDINAQQYWRIENPVDFVLHVGSLFRKLVVFPAGKLTLQKFTEKTIQSFTNIDIKTTRPSLFNANANSTNVNDWKNARDTENMFFELLKTYFEDRITAENHSKIQAIVSKLITSKKQRTEKIIFTQEEQDVLSSFNISKISQESFIRTLTTGDYDFNKPEDIKSFFTLDDNNPYHVMRYYIQVNLMEIINKVNFSESSSSSHSSATTSTYKSIHQALLTHSAPATEDYEIQDDTIDDETLNMILDNAVYEFIREHFESCITTENLFQITQAWRDYQEDDEEISSEMTEQFEYFNIPASKIENFKTRLSAEYGQDYSKLARICSNLSWITLQNPNTDIEKYAEFIMFDALLEKCAKNLAKTSNMDTMNSNSNRI